MQKKHVSITKEAEHKLLKFTFIGKGAKKGEVMTYDTRWIELVQDALKGKDSDGFLFTANRLENVAGIPKNKNNSNEQDSAKQAFEKKINSIVLELSRRMKQYIGKMS